MFGDDNPWSDWVGEGIFAHPDAPVRSGGGHGRVPGPIGYSHGAVHPYSPAGRMLSASEAAAGYAACELERVVTVLREGHAFPDVRFLAIDAFGQDGFGTRFLCGLSCTGVGSPLYGLQRLMVAAELDDYVQGRKSWPFSSATWGRYRMPKLRDVGQYLRPSWRVQCIGDSYLKASAEVRDALLKELETFFTRPEKVLVEARAKLDHRGRSEWQRYKKLVGRHDDVGESGWALGEALGYVLIALAGLMRKAEYHASVAGVLPVLTKHAQSLKDYVALQATSSPEAKPSASTAHARQPYHNDDTLTPEVEKGTFKPQREVDMNNLTPEENAARETMVEQDRTDEAAQKQLLSSADSFETVAVKQGGTLYGFTTQGVPKGKNSMYWLTEKDYREVEAKYCRNGVWDREGVKNHLALPCFNRANSIVKCEVIEDHAAIRSHIGPAMERVSYSNDVFTSGMNTKQMPGGGYQVTPSASKISTEARIS